MIAVIETAMGSLSHEVFNAGILYQLHNIYSNKEITYFCEREQAKCVKRILDEHGCKNNINFSYISRPFLEFSKKEMAANKREYIKIFSECYDADFVIILSLVYINSGLIKNIVGRFQNIKFGICIHGYIENILPQNDVKFEKRYNLFKALKEFRKNKIALEYFKRNLNEMALFSNCNIILYSDVYKNYKKYINQPLYENIKTLNLPYAFSYDGKAPVKSNIFKIGVMPSSAAAKDHNCIKIIQYMDRQRSRINYPYKFIIFNHYIGDFSNVIYFKSMKKTRKDIERFMNGCDWILIPYDENKYILSSSGVMFDAIEAERPFFALGSPSFFKAIDAGCGIQRKSIEDLCEQIIDKINDKNRNYGVYRENAARLKKQMEKENIEKLIEIFGKQ